MFQTENHLNGGQFCLRYLKSRRELLQRKVVQKCFSLFQLLYLAAHSPLVSFVVQNSVLVRAQYRSECSKTNQQHLYRRLVFPIENFILSENLSIFIQSFASFMRFQRRKVYQEKKWKKENAAIKFHVAHQNPIWNIIMCTVTIVPLLRIVLFW